MVLPEPKTMEEINLLASRTCIIQEQKTLDGKILDEVTIVSINITFICYIQ